MISSLGGISKEWAWEVAKAFISVNGLLIGFIILGMTVFLRRGYTRALFRKSVEESANEFIGELKDLKKKSEKITQKELQERLFSSALYPLMDIPLLRTLFSSSMEWLLISIGFALLLFGVSTETVNNYPILEFLFNAVYVWVITSFLWGVWSMMKGTSTILKRGTEVDTKQSVETVTSIFIRKMEEFEKTLKREQAKK